MGRRVPCPHLLGLGLALALGLALVLVLVSYVYLTERVGREQYVYDVQDAVC